MKKFSKILALALAVAMMLGMTAMAGTLYYQKDFTEEDWYSAWGNTIYQSDSYAFKFTAGGSYDVDTWKTAAGTKNIIIGGRYLINAATASKYLEFRPSSNGDKNLVQIATTGQSYLMAFLPKNSWDATTANEAYVVSYDIEEIDHDILSEPLAFGIFGKKADGKAYIARIASAYKSTDEETGEFLGYQYTGNESTLYGEPFVTYTETDTEARVAHKFVYDAENSTLTRMFAQDGIALLNAATTFDIEGMSTIEALATNLEKRNYGLGKIRAYTIDTATGLVATADINGKTGILPSTNKVTIAFNQPVGAANVAVTANGAAVEGVTTAVREIISGDSITSEVDVMFANPLSYGATYAINLSNVTNEVGDACVSAPITFETLAAPTVTVDTYEGLAEGKAIEVANAAGKTVYVKATVANSNSVALNGKVIIGIYDANGLVKYASATKALAANGNVEFAAAFKLAAGQSIVAEYK